MMNRARLWGIAVFVLLAALAPHAVFAQDVGNHGGTDLMETITGNVARKLAVPREQSASDHDRFKIVVPLTLQPSNQQAGSQLQSKRGRKVAYGILLGLAGMYGGAYLGAALEPNCRCDDPGLTGALIGVPIGAIGGAVFGVWLGGR
jgi:hypothetical protein